MKKNVLRKTGYVLASLAIVGSSLSTPLTVLASSESIQEQQSAILEQAKGYFTPEQQNELQQKMSEEGTKTATESRAKDFDPAITSLTLKTAGTSNINYSFTPAPNAKNAYEGKVQMQASTDLVGKLNGKSLILPNAKEYIEDFENGNYGGVVNVKFAEGVDAKAMYNAIDWQNSTAFSEFTVRILGANTLIWNLRFPNKWDRSTVEFPSDKKNEFKIRIVGAKKSELSEAEWNSYDPASTYAALTAAGLFPGAEKLADMKGSAGGTLTFDTTKYTGNLDDLSDDKEITAGKLAPSKDRFFAPEINFIDRTGLIAGDEGKKNIRKAKIKTGFEYSNPLTIKTKIPTWDSYLSIWDQEGIYNTNTPQNNEVTDEKGVLPGSSIFNRDLIVNAGDDFNEFKTDRFNRVVHYYDKKDVTKGNVGDINTIEVTHTPSNVISDNPTEVVYSGQVNYLDGSTRKLVPNTLNVTNKTMPTTEGTITPDEFTIGDTNITGTYTGDVAKLRLYINGVSVAWGGTVKDGKFTFYAGNQKIGPNDVITLNAYDKDDNLLQENVPVKVKNPETKGTIAPSQYTVGETNVTGSFTGDVVQAKLYVNGNYVSTGGTFVDGKFTYYVGNKIKQGDTAYLVAVDKNGKELDRKNISIKAPETKGTITPSLYTVGETNVTGSFTGDVVQAKLYVNGNYVSAGGTFTNGKFTYYVGNKIKQGDTAYLVAVDKNGKELDRKNISIKAPETKGTIAPSQYTVGESLIKGSYTGDVVKARLLVNGQSISWGGSFVNGAFTYYVNPGLIKTGDSVVLEAYDQSGKKLDFKNVSIKNSVTGSFTSANYKIGDTTIKGTFTGDITVAKVYINGVAQAWGGEFGGGAFSYYVGKNKIQSGDIVTIEGYDKNTQLLATTTVQITQ
ncbi:hypothetical protein HCA15_13365 [Listeria booriae]|uniref:immunoglobulin-like domain-containing protein n=1 Tax=Listeria booriae TaxID=1552123 RepID=UPI00164D9397|nr:immunoglobulin-like domain-containing protein [Listeria booriae]MBC6167638.1 hypothetical protein [Listeria booriae]